jgi:hypothetical protein
MIKFISIVYISSLLIGCTESNSEKDDLLNKIEDLQKSNDELKQKNDSLSTLINPPLEIEDVEDVVITENTETTSRPQPSIRNVEIEKEPEELTDNKPDESVSSPFASNNGGFDGSFNGQGSGGGYSAHGNWDGDGSSDGFGELTLLNKPKPPPQELDVGGYICIELTVNDRGQVLSAKSIYSCTTIKSEDVIKNVVDYVKKNVKFKAQPGAPIRKRTYTVEIQAG